MRSTLGYILPTLAASLLLAACGSSSKTQTSATSPAPSSTPSSSGTGAAVVRTASSPTLHATVLTNPQGMTLYALSAERGGKFICTNSACLQLWHPLTVSGTNVPSGSVSSIATVRRPEGTLQVTYKGMPLYTFSGDSKAGEAKGQGFKDVGTWGAVTAGSSAAGTTTRTAPASETTPSHYGY